MTTSPDRSIDIVVATLAVHALPLASPVISLMLLFNVGAAALRFSPVAWPTWLLKFVAGKPSTEKPMPCGFCTRM